MHRDVTFCLLEAGRINLGPHQSASDRNHEHALCSELAPHRIYLNHIDVQTPLGIGCYLRQ